MIELALLAKGQSRDGKLFELARRLTAMKGFALDDEALLRRALADWNRRRFDPVPPTGEARLWKQFVRALRNVRPPVGRTTFENLLVKARAMKSPSQAAWFPATPPYVLLVKLCLVLADNAAPEPFPLSVRLAAGAIGVSHGTAHTMLGQLERERFLVCGRRGEPGARSRTASVWRVEG